MRSDGVGKLPVVVDLVDRAHDLRRNLLVELHVALELGHDRARQGFGLNLFDRLVGDRPRFRLEETVAGHEARHLGARRSLDEDLDRAVGQFEQLQNAGERTGREDGVRRWIVVGRILLGREQDRLVGLHHLFERANGLLAPDEQRDDHVREHDDVAQRKDGIDVERSGDDGLVLIGHGCPEFRDWTVRLLRSFFISRLFERQNPPPKPPRVPCVRRANCTTLPRRRRCENHALRHERWASAARLSSGAATRRPDQLARSARSA